MALAYDNTGLGPTGGQWEYGGTGDGSPSLGTDVKKVSSWDAGGGHVIVPPNGCDTMVWVQFNDSDGSYMNNNSGLRCMARRGITFPNYGPGYEQAVVIACCDIGHLQSAMWVAPFEYHHTGTNLATTPTHIMKNTGGVAIDSFYGPATAAHDNSQRKPNFDLQFNGGKYAIQFKWHVFVHHMGFSSSNTGLANVYHGVEGTDSEVVSLTGLRSGISTIFAGTNMYELVGIYHGSGHAELLIAGWKAFKDTPASGGNPATSGIADALEWAATLLGGTAPADSNSFIGNWSTPSFVNSRSGIFVPSSYGNWSSPSRVRPYNPAPASAFAGNWSSPSRVHPWTDTPDPPVTPPDPDPGPPVVVTAGVTQRPRTLRSVRTWNT